MPRIDIRGRIVDVASPLLGVSRIPREFHTNDPAKLKDELGRLVDAIRSLGAEYAAPQLRPLPVAYTDTDLALGFAARVQPGAATVAATLPVTSVLFEGYALAVVKLGTDGIVRVTARSSDQLIQGAATFDLVEPGFYVFVTDGEHWYPQPDYATRIADVEDSLADVGDLLTIGSPRLLGRYSASVGLAQEVTIDDTLEMTVGGALQRAALTGDVTAAAGDNATTIATGGASDGDVLTVVAGAAAWQAPAGGLSICAAKVGITSSTTNTAVAFSAADLVDTAGYHNPSSNNTRFVAPENDVYRVIANLSTGGASPLNCGATLRKNGGVTPVAASSVTSPLASQGASGVTLMWTDALTAGDYLELFADFDAGGVAVTAYFTIEKLILP